MPKPSTSREQSRLPLRALVAGILTVIVHDALMKVVKLSGAPVGQYGKFGISLTTFAAGGVLAGFAVSRAGFSLRSIAIAFGALLIGVAIGVIVWNGLEDYVLIRLSPSTYQDRRLFPIEIMLLWMLGWVPMLVGLAAGAWFGPTSRRRG